MTALLALVGLWIPPLQVITSFIWTVPMVVAIIKYDLRAGILVTVVASLLVMIFSDPVRAFVQIVQFGGVGIIYGWLFKKQASPGKFVFWGSLVAGLSMFLVLLLSAGVTGVDLAAWDQQLNTSIESTIDLYRQIGLLDNMAARGVNEEELRQTMEQLALWFKAIIPGILIVSTIFSAIVNFLLARLIIKKLNFPVPYIPPFRYWQLPWYSVWGVIIGLALVLFGDYMQLPGMTTVGQNVLYIYFPFILINGLSVVVYFYKERLNSPLLRVLLIAFIVINWPLAGLFLSVIGVFDPLFDWRKLGKERVQ